MRARGITLQLAYRLRRYLLAGWPLSRWLGLALLSGSLASLIYWWPTFWPAALLAGCWLLATIVLTWCAWRQYVHFEPATEGNDPLQNLPAPPPLRQDEMVPVRASGVFSVEGQIRYYVDIEADFETVGSREHVILGRVYASQFLGISRWPSDDLGWWYIFFEPNMIRDVKMGRLSFGAMPRWVLRVAYTPDGEAQEAVYLTSDDMLTLRRIRDDLLTDALQYDLSP